MNTDLESDGKNDSTEEAAVDEDSVQDNEDKEST